MDQWTGPNPKSLLTKGNTKAISYLQQNKVLMMVKTFAKKFFL